MQEDKKIQLFNPGYVIIHNEKTVQVVVVINGENRIYNGSPEAVLRDWNFKGRWFERIVEELTKLIPPPKKPPEFIIVDFGDYDPIDSYEVTENSKLGKGKVMYKLFKY